MAKISPCRECGVPLQLSKSNKWHGNGTITVARDPGHRLLFCESDILDGLFGTIGEIICSPIDHIVQESKCGTARMYMEKRIPSFLSRLAYVVSPRLFAQFTADLTRVMGFGSVRVSEIRKDRGEDQVRLFVQYPYSLPLILGDIRAGLEVASGRHGTVACRPVEGEKSLYVVEMRVGRQAARLEKPAVPVRPPQKPGDIGYKRCPVCMIPVAISDYRWDLDRGMIFHPETGQRISIIGPDSLETVIAELERELGEAIPEAVIEAMRRFTRALFLKEFQGRLEEGELRHMLGLRGFGLLASYSLKNGLLEITVQNSCVPLVMTGLAKGLCEAATGVENTSHAWSLAEDGDLSISISPA